MSDNRKERLEALLSQQIRDAENYISGKIAPDRAKGYDYYYGNLPASQKGRPTIVKKVVFEKVQAALANIKEPFIAGRDIVKFQPFHSQDGYGACIASGIVNKILRTENNIDEVYTSLILDGLIAKSGTIKVFWDEKESAEEEYFENLSKDALDELLSEDDVTLVEKEENLPDFNLDMLMQMFPNFPLLSIYPAGLDALMEKATDWESFFRELPSLKEQLQPILDSMTTYSGIIEREIVTSTVKIKNIAPESFLVNETATCIDNATFVAEKAKVSMNDLYDMGFDTALLDDMPQNYSIQHDLGSVEQSRNSFDNTDTLFSAVEDNSVWLYECYIETALVKYDTDKAKGKPTKLYQMYLCNGVLLDYSEVDKIPYFSWSPLPVPHKFFGQSMAETLFAEQEMATTALRGAIQYLSFSVNPRYKATGGAEYNLAAFQSNLPGSIVPITKGDLVPFDYPRLDQSIFSIMSVIGENSDASSGVSNMAAGLNSETLKSNVSATAVAVANDASSRRMKEYALQLANNAIKPAYAYVYELFRKNSDDDILIQVDGKDVMVSPKSLPHRTNLDVDYSLGRNDQIDLANSLLQMKTRIEAGGLKSLQTTAQQYNLETDIMKATGIYDAQRYLTAPADSNTISDPAALALQQQQLQLQQQQLQQKQMELELEKQKLLLEKTKIENDFVIAKEKVRLDMMTAKFKMDHENDKLEFAQEKAADEQHMDEQKLEAQIIKDTAEIKLETEQQRGVSF